MTAPSIVGRAVHVSSTGENLTWTVPDGYDIQQGDLLYAAITRAGDAFNAPFQNTDFAETGTRGWDRHLCVLQGSGGNSIGIIFTTKVANGDEDGQVILENSDSNLYACVECGIIRGTDLNQDIRRVTAEAATGNIDPPGFTHPFGSVDALWMTFAGVDDSDGVTGGDPDWTLGTLLDNNSASGCVQVTATRQTNVSAQDPLHWTNTGNEEWAAATLAFAPIQPIAYPTIVRHHHSSNLTDHPITIPGGPNRGLYVFVNDLVTSLTLDPGGLNLPLSVATDGVTSAFANHASGFADSRWFTINPALLPPEGDYVIRRSGGTGNTLSAIVVQNAAQSLSVAHVANSIVDGATITSQVPATGGLILYGCSRGFAGGLSSETNPWTTFTSDGIRMRGFGTVYADEGGGGSGFCSIFARGYSAGGSISGVIASGSSQGVSAIVVAYEPRIFNAPLFCSVF